MEKWATGGVWEVSSQGRPGHSKYRLLEPQFMSHPSPGVSMCNRTTTPLVGMSFRSVQSVPLPGQYRQREGAPRCCEYSGNRTALSPSSGPSHPPLSGLNFDKEEVDTDIVGGRGGCYRRAVITNTTGHSTSGPLQQPPRKTLL